MPKKVILICDEDLDDKGTIITDMSSWDGDIIVPPLKSVTFEQNINCDTVQSISETMIFKSNLFCSFVSGKTVHVEGNMICRGNVEVGNLLVDGDCSVSGRMKCDNIQVFGHVGISGNLECSGKVNFMARSYLNGSENYAFGVKLNKKLPMVCFDQCRAYEPDSLDGILADRVFIMFDENGDEMISLPKSKTFMKADRFEFEFGYGYPGFSKYINEVKSFLKKGIET